VIPHRSLVLLAAAQLTGCFFSFKNPSEDLRAGQVSGTVLADVAGNGTPVARAGVAVSLKGAAFDQASRPNGRFVVLDLPAGRHRLLFRTGATWALERDVDIAYGSDGQPEGIELGGVVLHYSAAVEGSVTLPVGFTIAGGVAVDESSGMTALLEPGTSTVVDPAPPATFRFPMLALGTHLIKLQAVDTFANTWVGGQVVVNITEAEQGTTITLANVAARAASSLGRLRFRVQAIGLALSPSQVKVNLTPDPLLMNPITPPSDGWVDVTVPEGLYAIALVPPLPLPRWEEGAPTTLASLAPLVAPAAGVAVGAPLVYGVVLEGRVAEVGSVYVAADTSILASRLSCRVDGDCVGTSPCSSNVCQGMVPPPPVSASTTFCAGCLYQGQLVDVTGKPYPPPCLAGPGVTGICQCPASLGTACALTVGNGPRPTPSYCEPAACGFSCTPDGTSIATYIPVGAPCP
jgi:hypothetical protein